MPRKIKPIMLKLSKQGYEKIDETYTRAYCMNVADIRRMLWDAEPGQPVVVEVDDMSCYPFHGVDSIFK